MIANTKGDGEKSSEDFWVKAERLYYSALIGYIWYEAHGGRTELHHASGPDQCHVKPERMTRLIKSPVDYARLTSLEEQQPEHFAVKQYRKFKMAAGDICSK